jgi:hypothetical protein
MIYGKAFTAHSFSGTTHGISVFNRSRAVYALAWVLPLTPEVILRILI